MSLIARIIAGVAALLVLWQIPLLWQQGVANAHHFKSQYYLTKWQQGEAPTADSFTDALSSAQHAAAAVPENPHYLLTLAKIEEWGLYQHFLTAPNPQMADWFTQAIALRPTWPTAYADYAWYQIQIAQDFPAGIALLKQALQHGPYADEVLVRHLQLGLTYWAQLSIEDKFYFLDVFYRIANGPWRTYRHLPEQLAQHPQQRLVCQYVLNQQLTEVHRQRISRQLCLRWAGA